MNLKEFLNGRSRKEFAEKVGTTENYINNLCSNSHYVPGRKLADRILREANGLITRDELYYPEKNGDAGKKE